MATVVRNPLFYHQRPKWEPPSTYKMSPVMPVIVITGHGGIPMTVREMKAGAVEFLTNPFDDSVLLEAIGNALERSEAAIKDLAELNLLTII
jgi:FixJ family two-component response regulator